jgi:choline-sulfatase
MGALGYQTCLIGKMHFVGADQLHGYESRLTTDIYPADFGWTGDWTEVTQKHSNDIRSFTLAGTCLRNPQMEYDEEVTHRTQRKFFDLARGQDQRPFFMTVSFTHPHDPYQCSQEHWDLYQHNEIDMPVVPVVDELEDDPYSIRLRTQYGLNKADLSEEMVRVARHAYYGSISYADEQIGKVLTTLSQTGLAQNTYIIITSDHGDMLGERGLWYKKSFFEDSVRVPLIMAGPDINPDRISEPVSLLDLAPTFNSLAGYTATAPQSHDLVASAAADLEGDDLFKIINGAVSDRLIYSENLAEGAMAPIVMACNKQFKYICSGIDPEQLFDLHADPRELKNLKQEPAYATTLSDMRALVKQKWDLESLNKDVLKSQNQRLFIRSVLGPKASFDWDFKPSDQATEQCLRADKTYNEWAYDEVLGLQSSKASLVSD